MARPQKPSAKLENITPQILVIDGTAKVSSLQVAQHFNKQHKNVLRDIEHLECSEEFNRLNFELVKYIDPKGESRPSYHLTKDGFIFLVMGFTGKEAAKWKEAYIKAFNQMEQQLRHVEYYTPTSLGELFGCSAMEINLLLAQEGLQHYVTDRWETTPKGIPYAVRVVNVLPHHHWVCQLRWRIEIMTFLTPHHHLTPTQPNLPSTSSGTDLI